MGVGEARTRGREDTRTRRANAGTTERWPCRVQRRSSRRYVMPYCHPLDFVQERGFVRPSRRHHLALRVEGPYLSLTHHLLSALHHVPTLNQRPPSSSIDRLRLSRSEKQVGRRQRQGDRLRSTSCLPHPSPPLQLNPLSFLPSLRSTRRSERPLQVVSRRPRVPLRLPRTKLRSFVPSLTFCALLRPPPLRPPFVLTTASPLLVPQQKATELKGDSKVAAAEARGKAQQLKSDAKAELKDAELRGAEIKSGQQ